MRSRSSENPLFRILAQRLGLAILTLVVVSFFVFMAVSLLPGDFATATLGKEATPEAVAALQGQLGLGQPWPVRYLHWLMDVLTGNLGYSFSSQPGEPRLVSTMIVPRLLNTLFLASVTAAITVPLAVGMGIVAALYRGRTVDRLLNVSTLSLISTPEFFLAYILMYLLSVQVPLFPSLSNISSSMGMTELLLKVALPVLTLTLVVIAQIMRMTRAAIIGLLATPYIEMAQLKGVSATRIILHHAIPNAIAPVVNIIAMNLAYLISGVVVVEVVFVYPGIGQTMIDAVRNKDIPVVQACTLVFATTFVLLNLAADVVSIIANPRLLHPK